MISTASTATVTIYRSTLDSTKYVARYELLDERRNLLVDSYTHLDSDAAVDRCLREIANMCTLPLTVRDRRQGIPAGEWV